MKRYDIEYDEVKLVQRDDLGPDEPVIFQISDQSIDTYETRFMVDGWNLDYAKRNPIVTYGHPEFSSTDDTLIIGRHEVYKEGDKLMARVTFNRGNPRAVRVEKAVRGGFINMASIRASVEDMREVKVGDKKVLEFTRQTLYDFGIVMHGGNKNAFVEKRNAMIADLNHVEAPGDEEEKISTEELKGFNDSAEKARSIINKLKGKK